MRELPDYTRALETDRKAREQFDRVRAGTLGMSTTEMHADIRTKAAVTAVTTTAFPDARAGSDAILKLAEPRRLLAQMRGIVPSPPYTFVYDLPMDAEAGFVAESEPIPMIALTGDSTQTGTAKIAGIYAISDELARATEGALRTRFDQTVVRLVWLGENRELLSTTAAVANGRPAGLLNAAPEFGGGSPGDLETAIEEMFSYVTDGQAVAPHFITSPRAALWMALQRTSTGARFPNVRVNGGDIAGVPLLTSAAAGNRLVLVDAGALVVVDEGLDVQGSRQAAIQMSDAPSVGAANVVSAFQTGVALVKIQRFIHWTLLTDDAVAFTEIPELAGSPD